MYKTCLAHFFCSRVYIPAPFTFVETLRNFQDPTSSPFLCSFDISSLFTNVPLQETIEICANALYDDNLVPLPFPRKIFIELMQTATSSVEFSFNNTMYRQTDDVAMGSPLGPALAVSLLVTKKPNSFSM